jgi:HIV Tat-specific factor 1
MSGPPPSAAAGSSVEVQAATFADDPRYVYHTYVLLCKISAYMFFRIFFSKTSNTWRLEDDDGAESEYDATKGSWLPLVSSNLATAVDAR